MLTTAYLQAVKKASVHIRRLTILPGQRQDLRLQSRALLMQPAPSTFKCSVSVLCLSVFGFFFGLSVLHQAAYPWSQVASYLTAFSLAGLLTWTVCIC